MTVDQAMILAAGFGKRLQPFTNNLPKPLLAINGQTLIARHLEKLAAAGVQRVLINVAHLGSAIKEAIGDGSAWGVEVSYSHEPEAEPLETGGAIAQAIDWFCNKPFILVAADIWTEYDYAQLRPLTENESAHLILANKPHWASKSDFNLDADNKITHDEQSGYTFAGIAVIHPVMWSTQQPGRYPITKVLANPIMKKSVSGSVCNKPWFNIGCKERLNELCKYLEITTQQTNYHRVSTTLK